MRKGRRLGVDVGTVRIGLATCDPEGMLASPLETVRAGRGAMERISALVSELEAIEVVVGLPLRLAGDEGPAAQSARAFSEELARLVTPCPVRLVDERLTTVVATRGMRASGVSSRAGRSSVDQAAATVILQDVLDAERVGGTSPGEVVPVAS